MDEIKGAELINDEILDFEAKKLKLELEIAKNQETNRPTAEFTQASVEYNQAKERAEKLANELFPIPAEPETTEDAATPQEETAGQPTQQKTAAEESAAGKK